MPACQGVERPHGPSGPAYAVEAGSHDDRSVFFFFIVGHTNAGGSNSYEHVLYVHISNDITSETQGPCGK